MVMEALARPPALPSTLPGFVEAICRVAYPSFSILNRNVPRDAPIILREKRRVPSAYSPVWIPKTLRVCVGPAGQEVGKGKKIECSPEIGVRIGVRLDAMDVSADLPSLRAMRPRKRIGVLKGVLQAQAKKAWRPAERRGSVGKGDRRPAEIVQRRKSGNAAPKGSDDLIDRRSAERPRPGQGRILRTVRHGGSACG